MATPRNSGAWGELRALGEEHPSGRMMSQALLEAIIHPARREILRRLHGAAAGLRPSDLASDLGMGLPGVSYHVAAMNKKKVISCIGVQAETGCFEAHVYISNVAESKLLLAILEAVEEDDRAYFEASSGGG